jgi:hypothetical protein
MVAMMNTRRDFMKGSVAAALCASGLQAQTPTPARKLRIAGIGIGGMGAGNLGNVAGENIVALCDVDHAFAAPQFAKYPQAKRWVDFREMLEKQPEIEAVLIATPDHTHAMIALAALNAGTHVYCQKPLSHDIHEARMLGAAAAAAKGQVAVMGNQYHSSAAISSFPTTKWLAPWLAHLAPGRSGGVSPPEFFFPFGVNVRNLTAAHA